MLPSSVTLCATGQFRARLLCERREPRELHQRWQWQTGGQQGRRMETRRETAMPGMELSATRCAVVEPRLTSPALRRISQISPLLSSSCSRRCIELLESRAQLGSTPVHHSADCTHPHSVSSTRCHHVRPRGGPPPHRPHRHRSNRSNHTSNRIPTHSHPSPRQPPSLNPHHVVVPAARS